MPVAEVSRQHQRRVLFDGQSFNYSPWFYYPTDSNYDKLFGDPLGLLGRTKQPAYPSRVMSGRLYPWGIIGRSGVGYGLLLSSSAHNISDRLTPIVEAAPNDILVVLQGGQSDLTGYGPPFNYLGNAAPQTGLQTYTRIRNYTAAIRAICANYGRTCQVIATTIPPDADGTYYPDEVTYNSTTYYIEQARQDFNTFVLADTFADWDDVVDLGTISLQADGLHPSAAGAIEIANLVGPVLDTYLP